VATVRCSINGVELSRELAHAIRKYLNSTVGPRYLEARLSTAVGPVSFAIAAILQTCIDYALS